MAISPAIQALIDKFLGTNGAFAYNGQPYNVTTNPRGFARGGNQQGVFIAAMQDFASLAAAAADAGSVAIDAVATINGLVSTVQAAAQTATDKAAAAATSASAAAIGAAGVGYSPPVKPSLHIIARETLPAITYSFGRASTAATRYNARGVQETYGTDALRVDYDPVTGYLKGWMIEGSFANGAFYAEAFDNAVWSKNFVTISPNVAICPDGAQDADKVVEDTTASSAHYVNYAAGYTVASGVLATISVHVKAGERTAVIMRIDSGSTAAPANQQATFNLVNGAISNIAGTTASWFCIPQGNGWYRIGFTITSTAAGILRPLLMAANAAGSNFTYTGDGVSGFFAWGWQQELGGLSSYIPVLAGAAVTRAADLFTVPVDSWFNPIEGTLFVEGTLGPSGGANQVLMQIDDGTANNRIIIRRDTDLKVRLYVLTGGTQRVQAVGPILTDGAIYKVAARYKSGDSSISVNGAAVVTVGGAFTLPAMTTLRIGGGTVATEQANGAILRVGAMQRALADADLVKIAGPAFSWDAFAGDALRDGDINMLGDLGYQHALATYLGA